MRKETMERLDEKHIQLQTRATIQTEGSFQITN